MQHALALARKGSGLASPNPMVGCVIVREGQIVGEGFHQYEWRDHAEIVALKSAGEKARREVRGMRAACDVLCRESGTIRADAPRLRERRGPPRRKRLLRVVLDSKLRLSPKSRIVKTSGDDLLVFTTVPVNSAKVSK